MNGTNELEQALRDLTPAEVDRIVALSAAPQRGGGRGSRLTGSQRTFVLRCLAEYLGPMETVKAVKVRFGRDLTAAAVLWYRDHPRWKAEVQRIRAELEQRLDDVPIQSKRWRQRRRVEVFKRAASGVDINLGAARGLLLDGAREAGDLKDQAGGPINVNVQLVSAIFNLPAAELEAYANGEGLRPASYLSDLRGELDRVQADKAAAGELESGSDKTHSVALGADAPAGEVQDAELVPGPADDPNPST